MSEVLNRNLRLLEKYQPFVYRKLMLYKDGQYKPKNNLVERIILARQDDMVINLLVISKGREYLICDHENPINEAYAWIDKFADPSNKTDIVFGMGFGYHLEVLITSFKNKKVIIIEPNIDLFYQIISIRNLEPIITKSEIFLDEDTDIILERLHKLFWDNGQGGIQCQPFNVYSEIFYEEWEELRSKFIKQAENFTVDFATKKAFGQLWVHNNIKNAARLVDASNAQGLIGAFKGMPAVLVSSGPSLEKNIELLGTVKDKCLVMAAGVAVRKLEKYGVTPHFMVGIDATEEEAKLHREVKSKDIYFIYSNQVATGSVEGYGGPKFHINYPVDLFTADLLKFAGIKSDFFLSGPSVANTCFDILFKMGCNPIIIIGQDLSYPVEGDIKEGMILENDIFGKPVYTNAGFISMRNWFEGYFEKVKGRVEIINATGGGLNIQHAVNKDFKDVVDGLSTADVDFTERIKLIHQSCRFPKEIDCKLRDYKKIVGLEIDRLEQYCDEQQKIVNLIEKEVYHPRKNGKVFNKMVGRVADITNLVVNSGIYNTILKNIVDIDFYLIKLEVDRAVEGLKDYKDVKSIYTKAMKYQSDLLKEKLVEVKEYLK
jgi:hypothetical protein